MEYHSIGKKPYMADFEVSDELVPDPFAEEPERHTAAHINRYGRKNFQQLKNQETDRKNKNKSE